MSIKEQLMTDMKAAMKSGQTGKLALNVIRMARADIRKAEIDDGHADFNDDQVLAVLAKEMKQRRETLEEIKDSGRQDLIDQTQAEIAVLQKYLPKEMTEEEITVSVRKMIADIPAEERRINIVMKTVMPQFKGKADGRAVSRIVREILEET